MIAKPDYAVVYSKGSLLYNIKNKLSYLATLNDSDLESSSKKTNKQFGKFSHNIPV